MSPLPSHAPAGKASTAGSDLHHAIASLVEELDAVDSYNQRADTCQDVDLRAILIHNRDEEKEHAAMLVEWIRRNDGIFCEKFKDYVFTDKPITHR